MKSVCLVVQMVYDVDVRVRRKAEALVAAGYSVDVLALRPDSGQKKYALNGVQVHTVSLGKKRGSLVRYFYEYFAFFLWVFVRIPILMRRRHYAVIDVNTLPDFLIFAPILGRWMGAKLLLDMHEITPEFFMSKYGIGENTFAIRTLKFLEKISLQFADQVLTINKPIEDLFVRRGMARSKSTIIMNSADEARFQGGSPAAAATVGGERKKESRENFAMMYHGTLTEIYGLDIAIEAFAQVHEQMPGAELWILGSGPQRDRLIALARERGLASKVTFPGQVAAAEIPRWLDRCSVGILPIRRDVFLDYAFPNKLPEFIITGKAVIVSRLNAIRSYFSDDALAYFEPNSARDLAREMVRIYGDSQLRAKLARTAREEYAPIRWSVMKERYLSLIGQMAGEKTEPVQEFETTAARQ
ncbi:MAG TPA: glycosyltransferase family 4 protein [Bryobacteraceae bacterium]|nr:glycosyltransferase family 4 protein [Bryobacteraceae bacterium]